MITRRRRQGSESEHQLSAEVLKGPSSVLLWTGETQTQQTPSFFIVPHSESGYFETSETVHKEKAVEQEKNPSDKMALPSSISTALSNNSSRDRTEEFFKTIKSFESRSTNRVIGRLPQSMKNTEQYANYMKFMQAAKDIGKDLSSSYSKLMKLTDLAKRVTLFDDRPQEIQQLTYIIREDIAHLNKKIASLQGFMKEQQNQQPNTKTHSANVVVALQSRLANMSSEFKQVLEVRTENLKAQRSRREQYLGAGPVASDLPAAALSGGPFGSSQNGRGSILLRDAYQANGGEAVAIDMGATDRQISAPQLHQEGFADDAYLQGRADAVTSIESTIVELGEIFTQLALMIREQDEMVQRIDSNVEDAQLNIEAGHDELLRYFRSVTSNRWLMLKIFGVVFVFILIFAVFFA